MFDLFLGYINRDLANDDTTTCAYDLGNENVIKLLINKLFDWFSENFLNANPDKFYLLVNTDENVTLKFNQRLFGILFNNKFDFNEHVTSLCSKASQKFNAKKLRIT